MSGGFFSRAEIQAIVEKVRSPSLVGGAGKVVYVDGIGGADSNPPGDPLRPLKTIAYALGLCRNDKDDYIIVLDCWQQDTFPINIDKSRVHIIGLDVGNGKYPRMSPSGDTAIFTFGDKGYFEIAGFSLGAGASHGCIECKAGVIEARGKLHELWLGWTESGQDGILVPDLTDAPELEITGCFFGKLLTRDGIRYAGTSTRGVVRNNMFRRVGGKGIDMLKNGSDIGAILDNVFSIPDAVAGEAIYAAAGAGAALIAGNRAGNLKTDPTNNPYVDVTPSNDWVANYAGNTLTFPA